MSLGLPPWRVTAANPTQKSPAFDSAARSQDAVRWCRGSVERSIFFDRTERVPILTGCLGAMRKLVRIGQACDGQLSQTCLQRHDRPQEVDDAWRDFRPIDVEWLVIMTRVNVASSFGGSRSTSSTRLSYQSAYRAGTVQAD